MKKLLYLLGTLLLLSSCVDDKALLADLDHAETVMEEHPDSAYMLLVAHDSLMVSQQSRNTRMRYQLLMTEALNKLYQPLPTDSLFQPVVDYYDAHGTPNQQLKAHYLLGCIHRDRGEAPQALQCYYDAAEKADTLSSDCDYTLLYKVYGQMADVFEAQVMPDEEIEALKQYSKYALKAGNTYEYIRGMEYMGGAYDLKGDTVMILAIEKKVADLYKKNNMPQAAASAFTMTIYIKINRGDYKEARQLMNTFEKESGLFDGAGNIVEGREEYYHTKGLYYLGIGQLDSAEYEFKRLIPNGHSFNAYQGLIEVSRQRKDVSSIFAYTKLYEASLDTLVTNIHAQATRQALGMYDYSRHQQIAIQEAEKSEERLHIIYTLLLLFFTIFVLIFHLYTRAKAKKLLEIRLLKQRLASLFERYTHTKEELSILETDHIALKEKKQEELTYLQKQVQEIQTKYGHLLQSDNIEGLKQNPLIVNIKKKLDVAVYAQPLTEKEWHTLIEGFRHDMPQLYARITDNHILGTLEFRVTILTRIGFRSDDMAILLDISKQSISNAKANANSKLFSDNSARTFYQNLCQI